MSPILGEILGWEALLVVALVVLLFGGAKLPKLARSLGQASHEFRKGVADGAHDDDDAGTSGSGTTPDPS